MLRARTDFHREVAEALVSTKAIDVDKIGSVLSKYGARAAVAGEPLGVVINWRVIDICIPPPDPWEFMGGVIAERAIGAQAKA